MNVAQLIHLLQQEAPEAEVVINFQPQEFDVTPYLNPEGVWVVVLEPVE